MAGWKKALITLAGLGVILGLAGWEFFRSSRKSDYMTARLERGDIESNISATGSLNAVVSVLVGSQVSGNIKALYADFNTKVKKGQLVALIDPEMFQAKVDQARATLDNAKAAVVNARANAQKAEADIANAQATVATQKANVVKAQSAVQDAKTKLGHRIVMFQQGILDAEDRDTAQATYDQAVAALDAANAQQTAAEYAVRSAQAEREVAATQLDQAQALVKQNQAALEQAQLDLSHTRITAPLDGTVVARSMDVGQTVAASFSAPTIFTIAQDLTKMQVDTNVDEADIGRVRLGQPVNFTVDAFPGTTFHGAVTQIRQAPINVQNVVTYDAVIGVANPGLKLLPGMTANVKILTDRQQAVLRLPNAALRFRPAEVTNSRQRGSAAGPSAARRQTPLQTVWTLGADGKPKPVRVKLGINDGNYSAVVSGDLQEGEQVIVGSTSNSQRASTATPFGGGRRVGF